MLEGGRTEGSGDQLVNSEANKEAAQLKRENNKLCEENYLLKLKIDILLDMVRIAVSLNAIAALHTF